MKIQWAGKTHVGKERSHNEDSLLALESENLFLVADGMGGHNSGEIASKIAIETISNFYRATSDDGEITWPFKMDKEKNYDENRLITGIKLSNLRIFEAASLESQYQGMGTTIVCFIYNNQEAFLGYVGDSRIYLFRDGELSQLTVDHSLLNDYLKTRDLTPEEIENFPHKNIIVRALGMKEMVEVDTTKITPKPDDYFLLCSDGLSDMINNDKIASLIPDFQNLEQGCDILIDAANDAGGKDNISVILIKFSEEDKTEGEF